MAESLDGKSRIAIIGGGVSGIACLWGLRDSEHEVHLFEGDERLGGHANSVPFTGHGNTVRVDTGFIVMSPDSYPQFTNFLDTLRVPTTSTDMSFGVSEDRGAFEWSSLSLLSFIGTWRNLVSPWYWRLIFDILRFNFFATDIISETAENDNDTSCLESIGRYLQRERYSEQFHRYFIIPMVAAPWCIDPESFSRDFPAKFLIHFMAKHNLLSTVTHTLRWRTISQGSKTYVDAFQRTIPRHHRLRLNSPVAAVRREPNGQVSVISTQGNVEYFDHVVLAVHANQALGLLGPSAKPLEQELLSQFKTSRNVCVLHSDTSLLPRRRNAQVSWNCMMESGQEPSEGSEKAPGSISITFDMNRLQNIPSPGQPNSPGRVLVSMNPIRQPSNIQRTDVYYHPLFSSNSVLAARRLHEINGGDRISYAGAWMGYGFHEDGFAAGSQVALQILKGRDVSQPTYYGNVLDELEPKQSVGTAIVRVVIEVIQMTIEAFGSKSHRVH